MNNSDNYSILSTFISYAANILGDTMHGLTASEIGRYCTDYAVDFSIDIPHLSYPYDAPNKRTALRENLAAFSARQQYRIIKELCDLEKFKHKQNVKDLKIKLMSRYSNLSEEGDESEINESLIEETRHWLQDYPDSLSLYQDALTKFQNQIFTRNLLDDLRLSLELLLKTIFRNDRSLEKQINGVGNHLKAQNGSKELTNMFVKLLDYYCKYQNTYIKHDDSVIEEEIEFIFEITSSFMKHIVKLS